jgi:hypothetical protein
MFHYKRESIPAFSAAEVFENTLGRNYIKGRGLFICERTQCPEILPGTLQRDEIADNVNNVEAVSYIIYRFFGNHEGYSVRAMG